WQLLPAVAIVKMQKPDEGSGPSPPLTSARVWPPSDAPSRPVGDPTSVEAKRHAYGKLDDRQGRPGEVLRGENHNVAGVALRIVDVGQDISIVLGGCPTAGHEHRFHGRVTWAEVVHFGASGVDVMFVKGPTTRLVSPPVRRIAVAIVLSAAAVVNAREFAT